MPHNSIVQISGVIDSLTELKRMYQLNTELLEQLSVTFEYLKNSGVCLPDEEKFESLVNKAIALLEEIQADEPKILQYNASKRKVTDFFRNDETNGEVTEPISVLYIEGRGVCSEQARAATSRNASACGTLHNQQANTHNSHF